MFKETFTRTVGEDPKSFGIFQIALDLTAKPWYNNGMKTEFLTELGILLSFVRVSTDGVNSTLTIQQPITESDLSALSMLLYEATKAYESRKKETEKGTNQA